MYFIFSFRSLDSGQLPTIPSEYVSLVNSTNNLSTKNEKNSTTTTTDNNNNNIQRPERRNTFTLEDQVLKLGEHPSAIISRKQTFNVINNNSNNNVGITDTTTTISDNKLRYILDNKQMKNYDDSSRNKTYIEYNGKQKNLSNNNNNSNQLHNGTSEVEKQLRKRRTFTLDTDVESSVSLMTGPCSEEAEDPLERKRSASVGLIREKKSLTRKKKLKSINTQHKKPTWNNNFNHRGMIHKILVAVHNNDVLENAKLCQPYYC